MSLLSLERKRAMNLERSPLTGPLRVLLVNPLLLTTELLAEKILSGIVFGEDQPIHLIFLAKENELTDAEALKWALERCAFNSTSCIEIISNFPRISEADVFCIMTNLKNPNSIELCNLTKEENNSIHYLISFANNLIDSTILIDDVTGKLYLQDKNINPIILVDGLITMNILCNCGNNIPKNIIFSPNCLDSIAVKLLAKNFKTDCYSINDRLIWAADDKTFHIEVMKPLINPEKYSEKHNCKGQLAKDHTKIDSNQCSASWLKKDFIEKIKLLAAQNPYGPIYKAAVFSNTLKDIWTSGNENGKLTCLNIGVISEGSYQTLKGAPYVMPILFNGHTWIVNKNYEKDYHLIQEIKKMNLVAQNNLVTVTNYYKKLLEDVDEHMSKSSVNI